MGDAKKFIRILGWILASKFRFPLNTEAATRSHSSIAFSIWGGKGPELPIHVVQP
jgi:hypothetical protein